MPKWLDMPVHVVAMATRAMWVCLDSCYVPKTAIGTLRTQSIQPQYSIN
uniref:Uncharacterized protein n=1 Tax=viral metagenome TaxID=1070528 RepID=A0A6H1ZJR1_9ZZZZ